MKNKNIFNLQFAAIFSILSAIIATLLFIKHSGSSDSNESVEYWLLTFLSLSMGLTMGVIMRRHLVNKNAKEEKTYKQITDTDVSKEKNRGKETTSEINEKPIKVEERIEINIFDAQTTFSRMEERLLDELEALGKRAQNNLIIGSIIALFGWGLLFFFIYEVGGLGLEGWNIVNTFFPRLSIVIIMEVFSSFFLRLYKESIERIRYYQNEITNIEAKKAAIIVANMREIEKDCKKTIVENLLSVERNLFMKKEKTTMELEKYRIDSSLNNNLIKSIKELGFGLMPIKNKENSSQT